MREAPTRSYAARASTSPASSRSRTQSSNACAHPATGPGPPRRSSRPRLWTTPPLPKTRTPARGAARAPGPGRGAPSAARAPPARPRPPARRRAGTGSGAAPRRRDRGRAGVRLGRDAGLAEPLDDRRCQLRRAGRRVAQRVELRRKSVEVVNRGRRRAGGDPHRTGRLPVRRDDDDRGRPRDVRRPAPERLGVAVLLEGHHGRPVGDEQHGQLGRARGAGSILGSHVSAAGESLEERRPPSP